MKQPPINDGFDHYDKKYLCETCCCGHVHCLTGAFRVGIFMAVMLTIGTIGSFGKEGLNFGSIFVEVVEILCVVLLFAGISKLNPRFVLPFVIFMALGVIISVFIFIGLVAAAAFMNEDLFEYIKKHSKDPEMMKDTDKVQAIARTICIIAAVLVAFSILFNYWFFNIANRCYQYLKDYELYRLHIGSVALDSQQQIPSPIYPSAPPAYA